MSKKMSKAQAKMNEENKTPAHIKKLAIYLKINAEEEFNRNEDMFSFQLPIKKMFGLHVEAFVKVCRYNGLELNITAKNLGYYFDEINDYLEYRLFNANYGSTIKIKERTIKYYEDALITIFETMQNIKFNKFLGIFQSEKPDNCFMMSDRFESKKASLDIPNIFECFENIEHIELVYDKCCVCFENTIKKTHCDHYLCAECHDKINIIYCECGGHGDDCEVRCGYRPCPCCRKDLGKEKDDWKPTENP